MNIYESNKTMRRIGKQNALVLNDTVKAEIYDVLSVHRKNGSMGSMQMIIDIYLLGYSDGSEVQ